MSLTWSSMLIVLMLSILVDFKYIYKLFSSIKRVCTTGSALFSYLCMNITSIQLILHFDFDKYLKNVLCISSNTSNYTVCLFYCSEISHGNGSYLSTKVLCSCLGIMFISSNKISKASLLLLNVDI